MVVSVLIPFVGPLFGLLSPLPFLYYTARLGLYEGIKLAALTVAIIGTAAYFAGYPQLTLLSLEFSLIGLGLSALFRRNLTLGYTIFFGVCLMLLVGMTILFIIGLSRNMGPVETVLGYLEGHLRATMKAYQGEMAGEGALELQAYAKVFMATVSHIYPSLMIVGTGFALWLNVVIARPLFRLGNLEYPDFGPMDRWQAPEKLVWGLIAAGFALFLSSESIEFLTINALIVILAIYLFHGLAIVLFFLNKYRVPPWIRFGIYFLIIVQQLFFVVLILAGLFDQWADFRKIHRRTADRST